MLTRQMGQMTSHDYPDYESHDYRKKRTYLSAPSGVHSSIMRAQAYKPESGATLDQNQNSWIGKRIIYMGPSLAQMRDRRNAATVDTVREEEIAHYALPNIYRIIYVDEATDAQNLMFYDDQAISKSLRARSILNVDFRPSRLNILVDTNDIIRGIRYF
jgi:hypothetical protein